ncbi:MAG: hypothetical protein ACRDEB_06775 [Chitinophagaceae bacterium]
MNPAKIRLSQTEMDMVKNAGLILTKNDILIKVSQVLINLQVKQQEYLSLLKKKLPEKITASTYKISKGENYQGLPYRVLDFPRVFELENIFAVRTMFWWGHFFSVTLHLSGVYKNKAEEKLISNFAILKEKGFYCYINDDPWEHHFDSFNYANISDWSAHDFVRTVGEKSFVKIANKISLEQWDDAGEILLHYFTNLIDMIAD